MRIFSIQYIEGAISADEQLLVLNNIASKYTWDNTAKATLMAYNC